MNKGNIFQINVSTGGVPKRPVSHVLVNEMGIITDSQYDQKHHGGVDRALVIFSLELIQALRDEGHTISPGTIGENLTISGLSWERLVPGTHFTLGEVTAEVTSYASPCSKISASFLEGNFNRVNQKIHPGWSRLCLRVIEPGAIKSGDTVTVAAAALSTASGDHDPQDSP